MKTRTALKGILTAAALLLVGASAHSQTSIPRSVIASGGTEMAGTNIRLNGTIGQVVIGPTTSSSTVAWQGFWYTSTQQGPLSVEAASTGVGNAATAMRMFPNPVTDRASLHVRIPHSGQTTIKLYNALGQESLTLFDAYHEMGEFVVDFSAHDLAAGNYVAVLTAGGAQVSVPVLVVQ